jgi:hypothetical protein
VQKSKNFTLPLSLSLDPNSTVDGTELAGIDATYLAQNVSVSWHSLVDVVNISAW